MQVGTRWKAKTGDGIDCTIIFDDIGPLLQIDRALQHPREFFETPEHPERIVATTSNRYVFTFFGVYQVRRSVDFSHSFDQYRANLVAYGKHEYETDNVVTSISVTPSNDRLAILYRGHRIHRHVSSGSLTIEELDKQASFGLGFQVDLIFDDRCQAFEVKANDLTVVGNVLITTSSDIQGTTISETRQASIYFPKPVELSVALKEMNTLCDFMSMMVGEVVAPTRVVVQVDGHKDHRGVDTPVEIFAHWRPKGAELKPRDGWRCLAAPLINAEVYERALAGWMDRRSDWNQAYALGSVCLDNQREISRRRFLDAAAWFESIPVFYQKERQIVEKSVLTAAVSAAENAFASAGVSVSSGRTYALLSSINSLSLSQKVEDGLAFVESFLPNCYITPYMRYVARSLPKIRGKFAHGEDAFLGKFGHLVGDASMLFELLAGFLTLYSLDRFEMKFDEQSHPLRRGLAELRSRSGNEN